MQLVQQIPETARDVHAAWIDLRFLSDPVKLGAGIPLETAGRVMGPAAETQMHHRVADRPVPAVVDRESLEQRLASLEEFLDGVEKKALAEASGPGEEVVAAPIHQPLDPGGLVHVVAAVLANLAEGLNADGQYALGHGDILPRRRRGSMRAG